MPRARKSDAPSTREWPALSVEKVARASLAPFPRNARIHSPEQIGKIAASLKRFGWTMPILATEDGTIIAGHGRALAAESMGIDEVPVVRARGWSADEIAAYSLADNRLTEISLFDDDVLRETLRDLGEQGWDLPSLGWSDSELTSIMDGWSSDIAKTEKHGEHTDGIEITIKIRVAQVDGDRAQAAISHALANEGIAFEVP